MKASLLWLHDYLDGSVSADEAASTLTRLGFPVEDREMVAISDGSEDTQLDVEVTSNRGDCLSHIGVARELSVGMGLSLKEPAINMPQAGGVSADSLTSVAIEHYACSVFTARVIQGVKVGPSPTWLVDRLTAAGVRSINNVVDITNFVMLEMGQPLHAYDMKALDEQRIIVRGAAKGEKFEAINHETYELREGMLVIADAKRAVGLAGVMGGLDSEVTESTADVLLEAASFDAVAVRRSSRGMKLASDASYRFERGVDPLGVDRASRRAAALIVELAGGTLAEGVVRAGVDEPKPAEVSLRVSRCQALLGEPIPTETMVDALTRLGFGVVVQGSGEAERINATVPTHRLDITREVDLIEEVARVRGMAEVAVLDRLGLEVKAPDEAVTRSRRMTSTLVGLGFFETQTPSLMRASDVASFAGSDNQTLGGLWESNRADDRLRPSLLPSLLMVRKLNQDRGVSGGPGGIALFELASTWLRSDQGVGAAGLSESRRLSLLCDAEGGFDGEQAAIGRLRGAVETVVHQLTSGTRSVVIEALSDKASLDPAWQGVAAVMNPAGIVRVGDQVIGLLGILDQSVTDGTGLQCRVAGAEFDAAALLSMMPDETQSGAMTLTRFPGIERDVSVIIDETIAWAALESTVLSVNQGQGPDQLESLDYVGTYRGKPIEKGQKSVTLRMTFRDPQATLTHEAVDPRVNEVVEALKQSVGATLRG